LLLIPQQKLDEPLLLLVDPPLDPPLELPLELPLDPLLLLLQATARPIAPQSPTNTAALANCIGKVLPCGSPPRSVRFLTQPRQTVQDARTFSGVNERGDRLGDARLLRLGDPVKERDR
jgi:hypothetical protein